MDKFKRRSGFTNDLPKPSNKNDKNTDSDLEDKKISLNKRGNVKERSKLNAKLDDFRKMIDKKLTEEYSRNNMTVDVGIFLKNDAKIDVIKEFKKFGYKITEKSTASSNYVIVTVHMK